MRKLFLDFVPGLVGAGLAATAGYHVVSWISQQGLYAPVIPGALAGLACGFLSVRTSETRGGLCAMIALAAGLITQWQLIMRRVNTGPGFLDFLAHLQTENPIFLGMIAFGAAVGFWWGREANSPWRDHKPIVRTDD